MKTQRERIFPGCPTIKNKIMPPSLISSNPPCPHCGSLNLEEQKTKPPYYKKLVCLDCDQFVRWIPRPQGVEKTQEVLNQLESIERAKLSPWQREFVEKMIEVCNEALEAEKAVKLTPRQIDQIAELSFRVDSMLRR
jgi:hypothetical protein